jgi:Uma2 family endonuclease
LGKVLATNFMVRLNSRRRLPDILFVSKEHASHFTKTYLQGPPDLVIEIVSAESESRDWREKYLEYEAAGVPEYWIIDPNSATAEFYALHDGKYRQMPLDQQTFASVQLAGFRLKIQWLWQRPLPNVYEIAKVMGIF